MVGRADNLVAQCLRRLAHSRDFDTGGSCIMHHEQTNTATVPHFDAIQNHVLHVFIEATICFAYVFLFVCLDICCVCMLVFVHLFYMCCVCMLMGVHVFFTVVHVTYSSVNPFFRFLSLPTGTEYNAKHATCSKSVAAAVTHVAPSYAVRQRTRGCVYLGFARR